MIKLKGYYQEEPILFEDSVGNNDIKGYLHKAYYFLDKNTYTRAAKQLRIGLLKSADKFDFKPSDFNIKKDKYEIKDGKLFLYYKTGTQWELVNKCNIINDKKFIMDNKEVIFKEF